METDENVIIINFLQRVQAGDVPAFSLLDQLGVLE